MMIVPEAANMPPTPWQTEILAPATQKAREEVRLSSPPRRRGSRAAIEIFRASRFLLSQE
jgi:hypothetical protein